MSTTAILWVLWLAAAVPADGVPDEAADRTASTATDVDAAAEEAPAPPVQQGPKRISGMSVLGNQEAPKSLVIVPWQSSEIGESVGISTLLDDSKRPVDRAVFLRELRYYEIRSERTP